MEFKGSKGEWKIIEHSWSDTSIVSGDKTIASISIYDEATEETQEELENEAQANAKLMAGSQGLLEALQEAVIGYDWKKESYPDLWNKADDEHYEKCINAIKKTLL